MGLGDPSIIFIYIFIYITRLEITTKCSEAYRVTKYILPPLHNAVEFLLDGIDTH